jgi:tetratricopeptide (TPR) repeat protein
LNRIDELRHELAENPASLSFLELADKLRAGGNVADAEEVIATGLEKHPGFVEARSLYGEILLDRNRLREALIEWAEVIETDSRDVIARKGLGFLYFKGGQYDVALDHLEIALSVDPTDEQIRAAYIKVREALRARDNTREEVKGIQAEDPADTMLADSKGRPLMGAIVHDGKDVSEEVAAYVASVADEASRTARISGLGEWQWILCESAQGCAYVSQPTAETRLILVGSAGTRPAEIELRAVAAAEKAKQWLEQSRAR